MNFLKVLIEGLPLGSDDGKKTFAQAKNIFKGFLDLDFKNWDTDKPSEPAKAVKVNVYEMTNDATFNQMFNDISSDLDKLCLNQGQIIEFVQKHKEHLQPDGWATFFLFKSNNEFFVADVDVESDGLEARVRRFEGGGVWDAGHRSRLVAPQLP